VRRRLEAARSEYARRLASVEALSPLRVLERGFSLARDREGRLVKSVAQVAAGDPLAVQLVDGTVTARVEAVDRAPASGGRPSGGRPAGGTS
jgi:exodeoxyribonuclease VII large subunit